MMLGRHPVQVLHAGSIAAAIGSVATAADVTFCGGAGTAIAVCLSSIEVFKKSDKGIQDIATRFATALDVELAKSGLNKDRTIIVVQMLDRFRPSDAEIAAADKDAEKIVEGIMNRVRKSENASDYQSREALTDFANVMTSALADALAPQTMAEAVETENLKRHSDHSDKLVQLLALAEQGGEAKRMREVGITEDAILELAKNSANQTDDLGQAWKELQNLVEIAVRVQNDAKLGSNHGDFVDEVLRRSAERSAHGDNQGALSEIESALGVQEARAVRLLESGAKYALLDGDTARAAELLVRKADQSEEGRASFSALSRLQHNHYELGRDQGLNRELRLSIDLAAIVMLRASNSNERWTSRTNLAFAKHELGDRNGDVSLLIDAIADYDACLRELTRQDSAIEWAMTQTNKGSVLMSLGAREQENTRLEMAVDAFRASLEVLTQINAPKDWATTQMNLGVALFEWGTRDVGSRKLKKARDAFKESMKVQTKGAMPEAWARAQLNLGAVTQRIGERKNDVQELERAVAIYRSGLEVQSKAKIPMEWAKTQHNLGSVLTAIASRVNGTKELEEAILAYEACCEIYTKAQSPMPWAMVQGNLSDVYFTLFEKTKDMSCLRTAELHANGALDVFTQSETELQIKWMTKQIAAIIACRDAS